MTTWREGYLYARRFTRTLNNPGAIDDDLMEYVFNQSLEIISQLILESGVEWSTKQAEIDDSALGLEIQTKTFQLLIEQDLLILDLVKVQQLFRVSSSQIPVEIPHVPSRSQAYDLTGFGDGLTSREIWLETTGVDTLGRQRQALLIFNKGNALTGGNLWVNYWFRPQKVVKDDFLVPDSGGLFTAEPEIPEYLQRHLFEDALLKFTEVSEDRERHRMLEGRMLRPSGILERIRQFTSHFQKGDPVYGEIHFDEL